MSPRRAYGRPVKIALIVAGLIPLALIAVYAVTQSAAHDDLARCEAYA